MLLYYIIQYSYDLKAEEFVYLRLEGDYNQILSTILNETKKKKRKKKLGCHGEVLVEYIRLRPFLTKFNKVKVNLLAGNLRNAIIVQVSANLLVEWQIKSRPISYFWTYRKLYQLLKMPRYRQSQSFSYVI